LFKRFCRYGTPRFIGIITKHLYTHNTLKSHISDSVYDISTYYCEQTLRMQYTCPHPLFNH
jgi:hypothetical protein